MPSSSVPPSHENPVGSFETSDSKITTIPTTASDVNKDDSTHEDATIGTTEDQLITEEISDDRIEEETEKVVSPMANTLLAKVNDRKVTTEKEFQQLLMTTFQKLQDWRLQQQTLISTADMMLTDRQKSEVDDYISEYISIVRSNSNKISGMDDTDEHKQSNNMTPAMIWTLFQILFESSITGKQESIIGELAFWLNDYFEIDSMTNDKSELDWKLIKRLVMRGETANAASILANESEDDENDYNSLIDLLSDRPAAPTNISVSYRKTKWAAEWESWHYKVVSAWDRYKQTESFNEEDNHLQLMKILLGDKQVIRQNGTSADRCLATLLYTDPSEHGYDLSTVAKQVYDPSRDDDSISISIYNLFTGDYDALLGFIYDNLWMQVHFGHLLLVIGYIPSDDNERQDATITEESITEPIYYSLNLYATEIMHKYGMWTEAMQCIMVCRPNTNVWIKKLLGSPPLASEDLNYLKKVLEFCASHDLTAIEATLYSALGKRYEISGDFVDAATNYANANDVTALDSMAKNHLDLYLEKGTLRPVVTDAQYVTITNKSPYYSFYWQYCDLKSNIKDKQHDKAYQTSIKLLQSLDHTTEMYRVVLLVDIFDILKVHRRTNKEDTLLMIQQLDIATKNSDQKSFFSVYNDRCHSNTESPLSSDTVIIKLRERFEYNIIVTTLSF